MGVNNTVYENVYEAETETGCIAAPSIAERIYAFIEKNEILVLGFVLFTVTFGSLLYSYHKQLWLDEIFTIIVSSQPDLHHFAAAMPAEGNPPLNTFLTRLVIKVFGISQITVRLVPLAGFLTAVTGVYIFVRREAGRGFGIFAVLLAVLGPVWQYSYEARPYGVLLAMFMVALVGWQTATHIQDSDLDRSRIPALFCMAVGILGCAFSHYIGLIEIGVPLLVGEAVRTYLRRRVDWPLVLTGLCCSSSLLLIVPMMKRTHDIVIARSTILQPPLTLHKVLDYFKYAVTSWPQVMDNRIVLFAIVVAFVTWSPARKRLSLYASNKSAAPARTHVLWACFAASLLIPITWLAMFLGRGWYFCRYGIAAALGIVLWFCLLLARRKIRLPELVTVLLVIVAAQYLHEFEHEFRASPTTAASEAGELIKDYPSDLPVVVTDSMAYPTLWWYASVAEKPRIVFLGEPGSTDLLTAGLMSEKPYFHAPILDFDSFTNQTSHFLLEVYVGGPQGICNLLKKEGFAMKMVASRDGAMLFDVTRPKTTVSP